MTDNTNNTNEQASQNSNDYTTVANGILSSSAGGADKWFSTGIKHTSSRIVLRGISGFIVTITTVD